MKKTASLLVCFLLLLSCVGEDLINDYVDPDLRISNPIVSINEGFQYQFKARFFDESGTKIAKEKLLVLGRLNTKQSLQNGRLSAINNNGSIFANNVEVTNLGGEIIYGFTKQFSVNVTASFPLAGKVIYKAPALSAGIALEL